PDRLMALRDLEQRRIELDEGVIDGGLVLVARVACRRGGQWRGRLRQAFRAVEAKVAPATVSEPSLVLDGGFDRDYLALRAPTVVDRHVRLGRPHLQDEHRLVRPGPRPQELAIRATRDEDV